MVNAAEHWKANAQSYAAALNVLEESIVAMFPVTIRSAEHRPDPEALTQVADIIAGLWQLRNRLTAIDDLHAKWLLGDLTEEDFAQARSKK